MRTIAILCGRYLPGYKDGGPLRTLVNICDCLGKDYRIKVVTNDRDHGDTEPYPNIEYDKPNIVGNAEVWYLKPGGFTLSAIRRLTSDADLVYCFGPYDDYAYKSMILKRTGKMKVPLVIASMGSFSSGAIKIKSTKKKLFLAACKLFSLFKKVIWSVTSELESQDVKRYVGKKAVCYIAEDLPREVPPFAEKEPHQRLRGIFLSRICRMKNLSYALEALRKVSSQIEFDIYGIIEEKEYWESCKKQMESLPSNVICSYKGEANPEKVIEIFGEYDFFLLPTLGENYGHVIFESLAGGCIPVISDRTPWRDLAEQGVGYTLPIEDECAFVSAIEELSNLPKEELLSKQRKANAYAVKRYAQSVQNTGYRKVFDL